MSQNITDWGAALPKEFKQQSAGDIPELDIKKLFRAVILAPSMAGKTNLVFHILKKSPNQFSHLHIIARNPHQELYNYIREKLGDFVTFYPPDQPPSVDQIKADPRGGVQLVIIDDYSSDKKYQKDIFSHFFIRGRHKKLSTIFLTHSWFATDKLIRLNSEYVFILKANSMRDLRMIIGDFSIENCTLEKLMHAYRIATEDKGQTLMVDNVRSCLRYNFDKRAIDMAEL